MLKVFVSDFVAFAAVTLNEYTFPAPAFVSIASMLTVPVIAPSEENVKPLGKSPLVMRHEIGSPDALKSWL